LINNICVTSVFVKASDTNLWESISLLVGFIATYFGQVEFSLQPVAEFLTLSELDYPLMIENLIRAKAATHVHCKRIKFMLSCEITTNENC